MSRPLPDERHWISLPQALDAWEGGDGAGVRIAVVDSGVDATHPALEGLSLLDDLAAVAEGDAIRIVDGGGVDLFGHGTAIAYLIRKAAPKAEIGSFRMLGSDLKANGRAVRAAVLEAIARGYHILNCSFSLSDEGERSAGTYYSLEKQRVWADAAYIRNIHLVSACSNRDPRKVEWPGHFATSITVDKEVCDDRELFYRPGSLVEFAAKGYDVRVPWEKHTWEEGLSGSSYAAPLVAGGVARLLSVYPFVSAPQMKALLRHVALERPFLGVRSKQL